MDQVLDGIDDELAAWIRAQRGSEGLAEYRATRNATSLDGLPGMPAVQP